MAMAAGTCWFNWGSAGTFNGGGFDPTNAGFFTDLTTDSNTADTDSPVVSSASYTFTSDDIDYHVFVQSGTNWTPGWYKIVSVSGGKATLSAAVGAACMYGTNSLERNYHRPNGANTVAGCATVGTPTGGTWAIDYSQHYNAVTYVDLVIDATTNTDATSASRPFGKQMLGNIWNVLAGTGFTVQRVQLVSIPSGVIGRFDKSLGTLSSTGGNVALGGGIGSPSLLTALTLPNIVAGNSIWIKATSTYTLVATTTLTAAVKGSIAAGRILVEGYTTIPGARDGKPLITCATSNIAFITMNDNDYWEFAHLKFVHTASTRGTAFVGVTSVTTPVWFDDITCIGCLSFVITSSSTIGNIFISNCEIGYSTSTTGAITSSALASHSITMSGCVVYNSVAAVLYSTGGSSITLRAENCIFSSNQRMYQEISTAGGGALEFRNCVFYGHLLDAIELVNKTTAVNLTIVNNIFYGNAGAGIDNLSGVEEDSGAVLIRNNAWGNNGSNTLLLMRGLEEVDLTENPFVDAGNGNFALNNLAGGGLLCRGMGFPRTFPGGTTVNYRDIGAIQSRVPTPDEIAEEMWTYEERVLT